MSEGEATATLEEPTVAESEKVKAINGMKEVDEVKLQNGESEKPQINGDMEKDDDLDSGEQNGQDDGHEDIPKQKFSVSVERTLNEDEEKNGEKMEVDGEQNDHDVDEEVKEDGKEEKGSASDTGSLVDGEGEKSEVEKSKDDKSEEKVSEKDEKIDEKEVKEGDEDDEKNKDSEKKSEDKDGESKTEEKEKEKEKKDEVSETKTPGKKGKKGKNENNNNSTKKKKNDDIQEIPVTRQLRARKTPKKYTEDDDDIKITNEVIKDDSSDIEMIEESDPLAISDADVKKIQKEKKEITIKSKDPNVIIIDTNTLLKNQGNLAAAVAQSNTGSGVQTIHPRSSSSSSSSTVTNMSIQSAIQAITGGSPAQGLQSAYITALQQVLMSQGGQVPMNPQHLAQLQQYYNSLGHLQDDAYVIEAPSFIVPYVMEGKPKEPIKDFLKRINKELEDFEKKELEEDENKRKGEEKKKREAARLERRKRREEEKQKKLARGETVVEEDESEDEEEKKVKEEEEEEKEKEKEKEEEKEKEKKEEKEKDDEAKKDEEKMETDEDKEEEKKKKDDSDTETKDEEEKEDSEKAEVKDKKKEEDSEKDSKEEETKSDDEDKEEDETKKEDKDKKVDKDKDGKKDKDKDAETGDDDDKENKDKSDSDSVVDIDKDKEDLSYLGKWEPYYKSALGKFMLELGLNQAQEFLQSDLLRMQKRKLEKMKTQPSREGIMGVKLLEKQLDSTRKKNAHLLVPLRTCKFCTFKTESEMVMERHLESPHMVNYTYKCNFCEFETRGPQIILFHMEAEHNIRGRLERAPAFFQCSLCPYEDNNKSKMTRHSFSCAKKFKPERNCELLDWEPPAKIPKIHRGRPNTLGKAFEPVKMPNLLPKNMPGMNLNLTSSLISGSNAALSARGRGRPIGSYKNVVPMQNQGRGVNTVNSGSLVYTNRGTTTSSQGSGSQSFTLGNQMFHLVNGHLVPMSSGSGSVSSVSISSQSGGRVPRILPSSNTSSSTNPVSLIPGLGASSSITIQSVQTKGGNTKSPQQPSISITPLPRGGQQSSTGSGGKGSSSQSRGGDSGGKPSFVICEICDGYIKDLEQLRNHMNLIHKVKIHPKMIYNRPPLNCQKCQHRFFTDQGLERHLLGTHGLVTSSMQEAANKGKDAGRCPICGKVFQWKLLNHVSRDHKMTLKPAHLSYKCTVCTATFNMYRLFENHVYSAHSVVNKNKGEGGKKSGGSSDSPLKINDEITIIPQPAVGKTKTSTTSSSSSSPSEKTVSKKSEGGTPTMSKEITITKVGSRPTRRSGGSVEVISLDESPKKSSNGSNSSPSDKKRSSKDNLGNSSKKSKTSS